MSVKTIIACCASSMITSKIVAEKVNNLAKNHHIDSPTIIQCKFDDVNQQLANHKVDLIIPTSPFNMEIKQNIKIILGTSLITGINEQDVLDDILVALKV